MEKLNSEIELKLIYQSYVLNSETPVLDSRRVAKHKVKKDEIFSWGPGTFNVQNML